MPLEELRLITVAHHRFDGPPTVGELVVNASVVEDLRVVFRSLWDAGYPIASMRLIDEFGGDDLASVRANNTSSFNCRPVVGGTGWSRHAYGVAIDLNPLWNPYVLDGAAVPEESQPWVDRSRLERGMIGPEDAAVAAFESVGWTWGGRWNSPDYQHFVKE
ncbi:MAG: M15 family metallopeptidase [Microthrixaceae bacterium]|nr:M15 family metallopeptidase [Microthrixaceae bacterium]